ncbi:MAG: hypothetical protein JO146_05970 [Candidatus Eremiobacteraeota bacterium]|nr:hypothetical protein [Candidatus Eremiobacteraeota bacterium]
MKNGAAVVALIAAMAALPCCSARESNAAGSLPATVRRHAGSSSSSVTKAYDFLDRMMDKYAQGSTTRLVQSFDGGPLKKFTAAVTYDDALFVDAMLARAMPGDIARAKIVGDAFLYVQVRDKAGDGRLRAAYAPKPLRSSGDVIVDDNTSDVGNMAWVGQSLVQLYAKTSDAAYLDGALAIAQWLQSNTYDTRGAGGYTGGYTARGAKIEWKSTEHNIDVYAFFTMLATESGQSQWSTNAAWAEQFVASMWDSHDGRFYVGTGNDGVTPNKSFKPEDVNSWSYLAFENPSWGAAPSWDVVNLSVTRDGFSGVSFCSGDRSGVWFEGTAHLADALEIRDASGDRGQANQYLTDIEYAQAYGPNGDGLGIIAASRTISDCDGGKYYASLHVGATAWYILAAGAKDPFLLGSL